MSRLADQPISQLFKGAASIEPAPGGGSVAALTGMLGVALVLKALRISLKRREDAAEFSAADLALVKLAEAMAADADADASSFAAYIAAVRLPRGSPEETAARSRALQDAAAAATEAGLVALDHAIAASEQARALSQAVSEQMAPDLEAGLALLQVMRLNAVHNAEANLASVKDDARRQALWGRLKQLTSG